MAQPLFEVRGLKRYFRAGRRAVRALDRVSFGIFPGETLSLVGESGCGKTTCARTLLGIYPPAEGTVCWKGKDAARLTKNERTASRTTAQTLP